jgi:hypothetical protein
MYVSTKYERELDGMVFSYSSTRQGNVMKRVLVLFIMTICLVFAGAQSAPTTQASAFCELVCDDTFIDPNDGRCYQVCCPVDDKCGRACELKPCPE